MMPRFALFALLALAACDAPDPAANTGAGNTVTAAPTKDGMRTSSGRWDLVSSGEGDGLHFMGDAGETQALIFCAAGDSTILVNVRAFDPVASEERMTFGAGGEVVTLVASPTGAPLRGGVSGAGPVPAALPSILARPEGIGVNYGYQNAGPFPQVPADMARGFLSGCTD